jgi:hypothetical protein
MSEPPEIATNGVTVWVNREVCIGRFGRFGIDVHTATADDCLFCTFDETTAEDWEVFKAKMKEHHGVEISDEFKPKRFR